MVLLCDAVVTAVRRTMRIDKDDPVPGNAWAEIDATFLLGKQIGALQRKSLALKPKAIKASPQAKGGRVGSQAA